MQRDVRCPRCENGDVVLIAYGYPSAELLEEAKRGEVALGGCTIYRGAPSNECHACGHRFRRDEGGDAQA